MGRFRLRQIGGFLSAGSVSTLTHWGVMAGLVQAGATPISGTVSGSISGALTNYALQRRLAFPGAGPHRQAAWRFLASCGLAWIANAAVFFALTNLLLLPVATAQVTTTAAVAALNYRVYQRLVFHESTS